MDLTQKTTSEFIGPETGATFHYRPAPYAYKSHINDQAAKASSKVIGKHAGDQDGAMQAARITSAEVLLENRQDNLYLLLRCCLRDVTNGGAFKLEYVRENVGGIEIELASKESVNVLLDGVAMNDVAELVDLLESGITEADKKKSTDNDAGKAERVQESVSGLQGDMPNSDEG